MRSLFVSWIAALLCAVVAADAYAAQKQDIHIAELDVAVWQPDGVSNPGDTPVLLFSHGFHGCNTQSTFLMEALANAGYVVFAPNHEDAACGNPLKWLQPPQVAFKNPQGWNDGVYAGRGKDIKKLMDALSRDKRFSALDWSNVGMLGHSLGGYTALGIAGAWPAWKDKRVKAVLALSPYVAPFIAQHTLAELNVPVMYQGGTRDIGITPTVEKDGGAYDQSSSPKLYVEFAQAGHFAWTDLRGTAHDGMDAYSIAFFDHYLKYKPFPEELTKVQPGIAAFRADFKR